MSIQDNRIYQMQHDLDVAELAIATQYDKIEELVKGQGLLMGDYLSAKLMLDRQDEHIDKLTSHVKELAALLDYNIQATNQGIDVSIAFEEKLDKFERSLQSIIDYDASTDITLAKHVDLMQIILQRLDALERKAKQ